MADNVGGRLADQLFGGRIQQLHHARPIDQQDRVARAVQNGGEALAFTLCGGQQAGIFGGNRSLIGQRGQRRHVFVAERIDAQTLERHHADDLLRHFHGREQQRSNLGVDRRNVSRFMPRIARQIRLPGAQDFRRQTFV